VKIKTKNGRYILEGLRRRILGNRLRSAKRAIHVVEFRRMAGTQRARFHIHLLTSIVAMFHAALLLPMLIETVQTYERLLIPALIASSAVLLVGSAYTLAQLPQHHV
jgi:hypothetical protein